MAHEILEDNRAIFGFQRVPFIARHKKYGEIGELLGYKPSLNVAIYNSENREDLRKLLEYIFGTLVKIKS